MYRLVSIFFLFVYFSATVGCSIAGKVFSEQEWSENYTLIEGVSANDPAIIDGNVRTVGESQYVEGTGDRIGDLHRQSESVILLPEPMSILRVVVHSPNLQDFDIWTTDQQGRWEMVKEVKSNKKPVIDLRLNQTMYTSSIKFRIRRTADDAGMRRKNVQRGYGYRSYSGNLNAPAKIAEIELYGLVSKGDPEAPSQIDQREQELDDLLK